MSDINRAAERHVRIPDEWFNANPDGIFYLEPTDNENGVREQITHQKQNFIPVGIKVGRHDSDTSKQQDSSYTMATIRGFLHGESVAEMDDHEIVIGPMEPIRFRGIASLNTDGRKVVIYGA